jgi:GNAT superfamily N-acetyltransferase
MDICDTFLYSESIGLNRKNTVRYLSERIGYPDECSDFDKILGPTKYLFRIPLVNVPLTSCAANYLTAKKGYDILLLKVYDSILGHSAFQVHPDNSLHIFSIQVLENYRGRGFGERLVEDTLDVARDKHIDNVRIGGGNNAFTNKLYSRVALRDNVADLGQNYVRLLY